MRIADIPKHALIALIRAYQCVVSPFLPSACRYIPTCSEYAIEAIDGHGIGLGTLMAGWRLLRCHPFTRGGFDPVPLVGITSSPQCGRELIRRAPGLRESPSLAFWSGGGKRRIKRDECGARVGPHHSTAQPCTTH